jgi:hypothetical protein
MSPLARLAWLALALGCGAAGDRPPPLRIHREATAGGTVLVLTAEPGLRINARVKPALELRDGPVLRFDSPYLSADSAYFTRAPTAAWPAGRRRVTGRLRASVCSEHELVCRPVTLEL